METETFDDVAIVERPAPEPIKLILRADQKEGIGFRIEPPVPLTKLSGPSHKGESTMSIGWVDPKARMAALIGGGAAEGFSNGTEKFEDPRVVANQEPVITMQLDLLEHAGMAFALEHEGGEQQLLTKSRVAVLAAAIGVALGAAVYANTGAEASGKQPKSSVQTTDSN